MSDPPYLEDVRVQNYDVIAHEVRVTVTQRGETVHETTFELGAREPREYGGPYRPWEQVDCEWAGRGPFEVTCTVDGEQRETVRVDRTDAEEHSEYASVVLRISDTGAVRPAYVLIEDQSRHTPCDGPTPTPQ